MQRSERSRGSTGAAGWQVAIISPGLAGFLERGLNSGCTKQLAVGFV